MRSKTMTKINFSIYLQFNAATGMGGCAGMMGGYPRMKSG